MSDKRDSNREEAAEDLQKLFRRSANRLRSAAKKCRVQKGGVACDVLGVAAEIVGALGPALAAQGGPPEDELAATENDAHAAAPSGCPAPKPARDTSEAGRTEKE